MVDTAKSWKTKWWILADIWRIYLKEYNKMRNISVIRERIELIDKSFYLKTYSNHRNLNKNPVI